MRVKSHQIRAKVAFTKPLTTYLMRGKGDFSCRACDWLIETPTTQCEIFPLTLYCTFITVRICFVFKNKLFNFRNAITTEFFLIGLGSF